MIDGEKLLKIIDDDWGGCGCMDDRESELTEANGGHAGPVAGEHPLP